MRDRLSRGVGSGYDASAASGLGRGPRAGRNLAAPYSPTWPAPGATLDLDFANNRGFVRGVGQGGAMDAITFTRASNATYVGSDGLLKGYTTSTSATNLNAPRFDWGSTATYPMKNLLTNTEAFSSGNPALGVFSNVGVAPDGTTTADKFYGITGYSFGAGTISLWPSANAPSGFVISIYAKVGETDQFRFREGNVTGWTANFNLTSATCSSTGTTTATITSVGNGWYRCAWFYGAPLSGGVITFGLQGSFTPNNSDGLYAWGSQVELGSALTDYSPVTQATTVVPLAANPSCNGLLVEEARTNRILWCRDATQSNWTKTNLTAALDQTGIDGLANTASSLTATDANATCIQTITLASGSRTGSVYLKRISGTGSVQVTLDGTTYSTVDLSSTEWRRVVLSGTVTNPTVGIKLVTSGDAVAMDFAQAEDGAFATSPIFTTTATATRAADSATIPLTVPGGWYSFDSETWFMELVNAATAQSDPLRASGGSDLIVRLYANGTIAVIYISSLGQLNVTTRTRDLIRVAYRRSYGLLGAAADGSAAINPTRTLPFALTSPLLLSGGGTYTYRRLSFFPKRLPDAMLTQMTR